MNPPTHEELKWLAERQDGPCISIVLPLHRRPESIQDSVEFGNVLDHVEKLLALSRLKEPEVRRLLKPLRHLEKDREFWRADNSAATLVVLRSSDFFRAYRLSYQCPASTDVSQSFYVTPLIHPSPEDVRYFVLLLSPQTVRLLRCHRHSFREVELPDDVPRSLEALMAGTAVARSSKLHTAARGRNPATALGVQRGHGWTRAEEKKSLQEFVRTIARCLERILQQETAPLGVVAVETCQSMFRQACRYPHLLDAIHGSPDELTEREILDRALPLAEAWQQHRQSEAYGRCLIHTDHHRSVHDLEQLVAAARDGRIDTLFAASGVRKWGRYNRISGRVTPHASRINGDVDLLDDAVKQTVLHGGDVYVIPVEELCGEDFAAALRW